MAVIKRWWSEKLRQHLYLRADDAGTYRLTVVDGNHLAVEIEFATEQEARRYAEGWMGREPDGEWRQQPL